MLRHGEVLETPKVPGVFKSSTLGRTGETTLQAGGQITDHLPKHQTSHPPSYQIFPWWYDELYGEYSALGGGDELKAVHEPLDPDSSVHWCWLSGCDCGWRKSLITAHAQKLVGIVDGARFLPLTAVHLKPKPQTPNTKP